MILELEEISHRYGDERALNGVSFGADTGELVALLGPSGCGKTTIVQAIAGHVRPTGGRVRLREEDVTDTPPEARRVGLVFQQSTLFPHMTVRENVAYGLSARGIDSDERAGRVSEYLELVDLRGRGDARPAELSGGQQRRVELARALAPQPDVLLLDEPLSALDRALREQLRTEIGCIQRETGVTTLFVTHDQEEAMALADRLVVMEDGRVDAIGRPRELYESPPTPFVASFLGRSNELAGRIVTSKPLTVDIDGQPVSLAGAGGQGRIESAAVDGLTDGSVDGATGLREVPSESIPDGTNSAAVGPTQPDGGSPAESNRPDGGSLVEDWTEGDSVLCHVRPKDLSLRPTGRGASSVELVQASTENATAELLGTVTRIADLGRRYNVHVRIDCGEAGYEQELLVEHTAKPPASGDAVAVAFDPAAVTVFDAAESDRTGSDEPVGPNF